MTPALRRWNHARRHVAGTSLPNRSGTCHKIKELQDQLRNAGVSVFQQGSRPRLAKTVSHCPGSVRSDAQPARSREPPPTVPSFSSNIEGRGDSFLISEDVAETYYIFKNCSFPRMHACLLMACWTRDLKQNSPREAYHREITGRGKCQWWGPG
jgi:hypothetical protein